MSKTKIILVSGYLRRGKDTFTNLLKDILLVNGQNNKSYSFAGELKSDLAPIIRRMGIDVFNPTDFQKKIIRPIMIAYGCAWREIDIDHWVKMVDSHISTASQVKGGLPVVHIISDTRFISEAHYFINKYGRENVILVEVQRENGPTPPNEELENQPKLTAIADHIINWPTVGDDNIQELRNYVVDFYKKYLTK